MSIRTDIEYSRTATVSRALLAWGVIAGPFYLALGLGQALFRDGFDLTQHALSLLMLGEFGWIQRVNLIGTGMMVLAAAAGFARVMPGRSGMSVSLSLFGACLVLSGVALPDAMAGFPPGSEELSSPSISGLVHLAAGGLGFLACALAAVLSAQWFKQIAAPRIAWFSRAAAALVLTGFFGGAAMAANTVGLVLLWFAVVMAFVWLMMASFFAYRIALKSICRTSIAN